MIFGVLQLKKILGWLKTVNLFLCQCSLLRLDLITSGLNMRGTLAYWLWVDIWPILYEDARCPCDIFSSDNNLCSNIGTRFFTSFFLDWTATAGMHCDSDLNVDTIRHTVLTCSLHLIGYELS